MVLWRTSWIPFRPRSSGVPEIDDPIADFKAALQPAMDILGTDGLNFALTILLLLSTAFTLSLVFLPTRFNPYGADLVDEDGHQESSDTIQNDGSSRRKITAKTSVQVVVLGDIGRSPRMQYHAISIAKHGGRVELIGYSESDVHPDIESSSKIYIIAISTPPAWLRTNSKALFLIMGPLKVLWQVWSLWYALGYQSKASRWMLVQNPPSIPTLAVATIVCFLRNTSLAIDWHNFGYSILALKLGPKHPLVRVSEVYESVFSRFAASHFAVTNAMARFLAKSYSVSALPLHDRPAPIFQPLSPLQRASFLARLPETAQYAKDIENGTWRLIVSSTSWTPDEDFSVLLDALVKYSERAASQTHLPKILAIITGKGPQKEHYMSKIHTLSQEKKLQNVLVLTAWLSASDYATLLGAADLGISLHTSSSGVDLPMKVVDMFGTGLPVLGWSDFEAWPELVKEDFNGRGFTSAEELEQQLVALFGDDGSHLKRLREGALKECTHRWDDEWDLVAGKLFKLVE